MKILSIAFFLCVVTCTSTAQSKVFKEVSEDISSEMKIITQDDALVGYLLFTQLEKTSADSFNYKISLMDENLNDIGAVNFREENLDLEAVSFEQDVLCLAYLKSNINGKEFKNKKEYNNFDGKNSIFTQFLTLDGKIIKTNTLGIQLQSDNYEIWASPKNKFTYHGNLKHGVQLKNIFQKGFVCFFGDKDGCNLITYDLAGKEGWKKNFAEKQAYSLLTSKTDIYLLEKSMEKYYEGGYYLAGYNFEDGHTYDRITLNDNEGNSLKVLGFGKDPLTGIPYVSGNIIDPEKGNNFSSGKELARGPYTGIFSMDINGHSKKEIKKTFIYWNNGSQKPIVSKRGYLSGSKSYNRMSTSFRDFNGNTYFVGSEFIKKPKIGAIVASVITAPLFVVPLYILGAAGTTKCKVTDASLMKINPKGVLSFENSIPCNNSKFVKGIQLFSKINSDRGYYGVENPDTKANYIVADDSKNIMIYSVNKKKVVRTIPHKDGKISTQVFPAKEGHIMVVEKNKKEKYTRLSIEALD